MNQTARDKLDEQLLELAMVAQQEQPLTHGRRVALSKLINAIVLSGKVCRPQSGKFTFNLYEDIYHEALQELLLYICQNIDKYDAKRASVMAWVNFLLERRFFSEAVAKALGRREITKVPIQDNLAVPEEPEDLTEIIKEYIALDPENLFKQKHVKDHPQANFQALVQRRLSGKPWEEIAAEFEINVGTVSSFYSRCINVFAPGLRKHCSNDLN